jgi:4-amino-4-deoxy-L-arabinose transferase-like glycosyltransferase
MTALEDRRPGARQLLAIALLAVGLRVLLFAVASAIKHTTFTDFAGTADGYQYLAYARAWLGPDAEFAAHPIFGRFFPGYPMLIAGLHFLGMPLAAAALLPSWLAAGAVAVLCALYFGDRRIGWAMAALTPSYVFSGSLICSEVMCLLFSMTGLVLARRERMIYAWIAGVAFGLGGLFRPVAVFALLGVALADLWERRLGRAVLMTALSGLTVAAGLAAVHWRFGDALMSLRQYQDPNMAYGDHLITWPFRSLITIPLTSQVPAWKLAFVGVHLAAVLGGCVLAVREWRQAADGPERRLATIAGVWLLANTLYVVSIGGFWGFHDFPRFLVPALPPLFFVYRRLLPVRRWVWLPVGALSVILSIEPTTRRLTPAPTAAPTANKPTEATWQTPGVRPSAS